MHVAPVIISCVELVSGERLRAARRRHVLSQEELADRAHISRSTVNKLEAGGRSARPATIRQLARVLKVDARELVIPDER